MNAEHLIWFLFFSLLAEIIGTVGGFGSSLFFVPIASFFLEFHAVLGVTAVFHVTSNAIKIFFFRSGIHKKLLIQLGLPALLFVILGAYLSKYVSSQKLEITLAAFLIFSSLLLLIFSSIKITPTLSNTVTGGILSGIAAGMLGTGGAIRGITLAAYQLNTNVFIATSAWIDFGIDSGRSIVYAINGYIQKEHVLIIALLSVVSFCGTFIGKKLLEHISDTQFRKIALLLVLFTGIATLIKILTSEID